jgi:hypothetical protein
MILVLMLLLRLLLVIVVRFLRQRLGRLLRLRRIVMRKVFVLIFLDRNRIRKVIFFLDLRCFFLILLLLGL